MATANTSNIQLAHQHFFRVKMRRTSKPVVFNLFYAATHFATQFNLTTPFRKFPVRHMKCSCVCTIENYNDYKIRMISLC